MVPTGSLRVIIDQSKEYLETKIKLTKFKTVDSTAEILSALIALTIIVLVAVLGIVFLSVGLAILVNKLLGSHEIGFFIMAGFYAIVVLIIYMRREKWLKTPIANNLIGKMQKKHHEENAHVVRS